MYVPMSQVLVIGIWAIAVVGVLIKCVFPGRFDKVAILLYLAGKTGRFYPHDLRGRCDVAQWLFWQMGGLGPMAGQIGFFNVYAPEKVPYAIERYARETRRLYGVLDKRLADREFVAGEYSIADVACYPWIVPYAGHRQNLEDFAHLKRWFTTVGARPAVERTYAGVEDVYAQKGASIPDDAKQLLFGHTASSARS